MKAEDYRQRKVEVDGWQVNLASYKLGEVYHCSADNVSPGATLARTTAATREEAESKALERATQLLARTRRRPVEAL
ncbi:MAG: hypothetical protein M3Y07_15370 [Acidobacteriota bacterium]|nr:hypothetical protein [Acidobacteriota bacterium]